MPDGSAIANVKKLVFNQLQGLGRHNERGGGASVSLESVEVIETVTLDADGHQTSVKVEVYEQGKLAHSWTPTETTKVEDGGFEVTLGDDGVCRRNPNIDAKRTKYNYSLIGPRKYPGDDGKPRRETYEVAFERICLEAGTKGKIKKCGPVKKQSKVACALVVPSPWRFGEVPMEQQVSYFARATEVFSKMYGRENVISAVVHMDERTPHLHFTFVPIVKEVDKQGRETGVKKVLASQVWRGFNSYGKLQTEFHREMVRHFPTVRRGVVGGKNRDGEEYIPDVADYRAVKAQEERIAAIPVERQRSMFGTETGKVLVKESDWQETKQAAISSARMAPEISRLRRRRRWSEEKASEVERRMKELDAREVEVLGKETASDAREQRTKALEGEATEARKRYEKQLEQVLPRAKDLVREDIRKEFAEQEKRLQKRGDALGADERGMADRIKKVELREQEAAIAQSTIEETVNGRVAENLRDKSAALDVALAGIPSKVNAAVKDRETELKMGRDKLKADQETLRKDQKSLKEGQRKLDEDRNALDGLVRDKAQKLQDEALPGLKSSAERNAKMALSDKEKGLDARIAKLDEEVNAAAEDRAKKLHEDALPSLKKQAKEEVGRTFLDREKTIEEGEKTLAVRVKDQDAEVERLVADGVKAEKETLGWDSYAVQLDRQNYRTAFEEVKRHRAQFGRVEHLNQYCRSLLKVIEEMAVGIVVAGVRIGYAAPDALRALEDRLKPLTDGINKLYAQSGGEVLPPFNVERVLARIQEKDTP